MLPQLLLFGFNFSLLLFSFGLDTKLFELGVMAVYDDVVGLNVGLYFEGNLLLPQLLIFGFDFFSFLFSLNLDAKFFGLLTFFRAVLELEFSLFAK